MCHRKLLAKLEYYGVRDPLLKCFNSYLISSLQRVVLNGLYSNWNEVKSGIRQVSLLGPALFFLICQWHAKLYNWNYAGNVCWRFKVLQMQWITRWLWHHPNWLKPPTTLVVGKRNDLPAQKVWKLWGFKETHKSRTILTFQRHVKNTDLSYKDRLIALNLLPINYWFEHLHLLYFFKCKLGYNEFCLDSYWFHIFHSFFLIFKGVGSVLHLAGYLLFFWVHTCLSWQIDEISK